MNCNCSRCGVEGQLVQDETTQVPNQNILDLAHAPWNRYARPGEAYLCVTCLMSDPAFKAQQAAGGLGNEPGSGAIGDPGYHIQNL